MQDESEVVVLRLGHRVGRDDRMTTHVGLVARAFGADRILLPSTAATIAESVTAVTERFGGPFTVESYESHTGIIRKWDGVIVHLTMYGERVQDVIGEIQATHIETPVLVVVGAGKVPFEVFEGADWNVGITNQPHSEIAALAVFLDRLFNGRGLEQEWKDAQHRIIPNPVGKTVEQVERKD